MTSEGMGEVEGDDENQEFSGVLYIYVHHARNIHNICIYDNQDVYAKFSLTSNPDETLSTKVVKCGGRNPEFNESLQLDISQKEAVLKCEIWMQSRAKNYLEDQLLGFALVPLSSLLSSNKVTKDFPLSSTDLIHSPAGTVRLTLMFQGTDPGSSCSKAFAGSNLAPSPSFITSEVVLLDRTNEELHIADYSSVEFPDVEAAREDQRILSEYFKIAAEGMKSESNMRTNQVLEAQSNSEGPFLHLGACFTTDDDYDMTVNTEATQAEPSCFGQIPREAENSSQTGTVCSTTTSVGDELNSQDMSDHKNQFPSQISTQSKMQMVGDSPETGTSVDGVKGKPNQAYSLQKDISNKDSKESAGESKMDEETSQARQNRPFININFKPEETVVQQQIVDMYMKSMQQFTESLAKMTLPIDLESKGSEDQVAADQTNKSTQKRLDNGKKDGSRVFYGSRAFF
eukprot:TRINITY_DN47_c0_g1_i1.p1 TRINITY_DN47_c0_g1~~TRINITY_DN47_c0_g1_i1.p1  ORF type:complete len:457 (-),score=68.42 TRINITY_DN47_c0_g1_i1:1187-2557(-)